MKGCAGQIAASLKMMTHTLWVGALFLVACGPMQDDIRPVADEINYWEQRKGDCEMVLSSSHSYDVDRIVHCMKVWETYRSVADLSLSMRSMYAVAFSTVWYQSRSDYDRAIAEAALNRLCVPRHPQVNGKVVEEVPQALACGTGQVTVGVKKEPTAVAAAQAKAASPYEGLRGSVDVNRVNDKRQKAAANANKQGVRAHSKRQWGQAVDAYEQALAQYPHYVTAKYNLICTLAVMGDTEAAIRGLEELYTWNDSEVEARLIKARSDEDLLLLRDDLRFKLLTGYFRMIIGNGAGELGLDQVMRIKAELEARRYAVADLRNTTRIYTVPEIWYRPGFEEHAERIRTILGVKRVRMERIDYDTLDDMMIIWGQPDAVNISVDVHAPVVQGTRAEGKGSGLSDLTGAVKDTQGEVDGAVKTGSGVKDSVPQ